MRSGETSQSFLHQFAYHNLLYPFMIVLVYTCGAFLIKSYVVGSILQIFSVFGR